MDELSKLKQMWESSFDGHDDTVDSDKLLEMIRSKSSGPVDKLKKSLYIEIGTILLVIPLLVVVMFKLPELYFVLNTSVLFVLFTGSLLYYYYNLRKITTLWNQSQDNMRRSLESTLLLLHFFRKTYFYLNILLFPLGVYFGYVIGFGLGSGGKKVTSLLLLEHIPYWMNVMLWITAGALFFGLFLLFLRFYVRKLYDVHINKLELIHHELIENEH